MNMPAKQLSSPNPLGEPSFFILLSLSAGARHGYAVMKDVELVSSGRVKLSVSTLYTTLGRLLDQGLIERSDDGAGEEVPSQGLPRKVYRLTRRGQQALSFEAKRLDSLLAVYRLRVGEGHP